MPNRSLIFACACTLIVCLESRSQGQAPTTIQLPSFSSFSYQGTVVVPDRGQAHLGSVRRSARGTSRRGLSRAFGSDQSIAQASVKAHIIDHAEMDRQILGADPQEFLRRERAQEAQAKVAGRNVKAIDPDTEGKALVRHARKEYKAGKHSTAFVSYQMAIEVLESRRLKDYAIVEFKRVFGSSADQALRMNTRRRF